MTPARQFTDASDALGAEFGASLFEAWRWEGLQDYAATETPEDKAAWLSILDASRLAGRKHRRVRRVRYPLTAYTVWELTAGYAPNVGSGEKIRVVEDSFPYDGPDFWLFDRTRLYVQHYTPAGLWVGAERITDPVYVAAACQLRDQAWRAGVPWRAYVEGRPELRGRLAA